MQRQLTVTSYVIVSEHYEEPRPVIVKKIISHLPCKLFLANLEFDSYFQRELIQYECSS